MRGLEFQPLALVVEDQEQLRETRIELLELHGFTAIGASSKRDAERELRACPSVDVIVTDVNLDPLRQADRSGLDLAREVKLRYPSLPIMGYSAQFEENDIPSESLGFFDMILLKGRQNIEQLKLNITELRSKAVAYRDTRERNAEREMSRLRERYEIDPYDFELLREFLPGLRTTPSEDALTIEDALREAGYTLRIIDQWAAEDADEVVRLKSPVAIWLRATDEAVIAEAYGFPELYASGVDEREATTRLLFLMEGYFRDLRHSSNEKLGSTLIRLRDYLSQLFGS